MLTSPELYKTRTLLGRTESCLYVCLCFPEETNARWFTLYRKPNHATKKKKKKKDSSYNTLAPVPTLNSPPVESSGFIAVDSNIHAMEDSQCPNVWFLDCRTHTWLEAPTMRLARPKRKVYMYLAGSSEKPECLNFVEVYNTKTQTWRLPENPKQCKNMEGKVYVKYGKNYMVMRPKTRNCELVNLDTNMGRMCIIDKITYLYESFGMFLWKKFNTKGAVARPLKGLEGLPRFARCSTVKLLDYGGKLMVLWDKSVRTSGKKEKTIWCAEISLERRNDEVWGKVEWINALLTVPSPYNFVSAVAATL